VKNEKFADAKEHFQKAIAVKPSAAAWTYLAIADEKTGDRQGAIAAYKSALGLDPAFVEAAQNLAAIYLDDPARPDDAIAVLKPAIAKSGDPQLLQNLGYAYGLKGDLDAANKAYEASLAKGEDAQARYAWGMLLVKNKQQDRAAAQLKKTVDGAGADVELLVLAGVALDGVGAPGDCVRAFDKALKIKATNPDWFVRRGRCKHALEDEAGASADFEAAIKVDASFAPAHLYLGVSAIAQNNRLKASLELAKAEKLGGDGPVGKVAHQKLVELAKKK
jgi:tetratricopeptide (TPR) repeat protein